MAVEWRGRFPLVNKSLDVACRPRCLAVPRVAGHSADACVWRTLEGGIFGPFRRVFRPDDSPDLEELPMSDAVKVGFVPLSTAPRGVLFVFCDDALKFGSATRKALGEAAGTVKRAAAANQFKGKNGSILDIPAPEGIKIQRLVVVGVGKGNDLKETDFLKFGGLIAGKLNAASGQVTILAELPDEAMTVEQAAQVASGLRLRAYKFTR